MGKKDYYDRRLILILGLGMVFGIGVFLLDNMGALVSLERGDYGTDTEVEELQVTVEGDATLKDYKMPVEVKERLYTEEEIRGIFQLEIEQLEAVVLGENESFDRITQEVHLVEESEKYPINMGWKWHPYPVFDVKEGKGVLQEDEIPKEGVLVELIGTLTYEDQQAQYIQNMMVYPPEQSEAELLVHSIETAVLESDRNSAYKETFSLPSKVEGIPLIWKKTVEYRGIYIMVLTVVGILLWIYRRVEQEKELENLRIVELTRDYPELINRIVLLVGAGLTVRMAWKKILENQRENPSHLVYKEMLVTEREMENGITESEAYERFGNRCNVSYYRKLGHLLSQNLRRGSKGLVAILEVEACEAREQKKIRVRLLGETAATKLLMPMFLMLTIVLIVIVIPAFLTIQI